jgi:CheY-like chemotaxis protein
LDGCKALERLRNPPDRDVVVLDVGMPDMDGLKVLVAIKKENPMVESFC